MYQHFINRGEELNLLGEIYRSRKAEFVVIYGRRRVGKTELVLNFVADKPSIYFLAEERRDKENLEEFKSRVGEYLKDEWLARLEVEGWPELFRYIAQNLGDSKPVIIIDEFPYLVKHNSGIPSAFQKAWDLYLKNSSIMLVIVGSSISMIEDLLGYKSPLYGRRTAQLEVRPLKFLDTSKFLPNYSLDELIKVYSCVGGIPFYVAQFDRNKTFSQNLEDLFLKRGRFLYEEADFLLKQEFREPANYFSLLKSISFGYTKYGEIVNYTGLDKSIVSKYLDNLAKIRVVKKSYPVLSKKEKTRDTRYEITDNYYKFWFRFVYPNKSLIEENRSKEVLKKIENGMNTYLGPIFEEVSSMILPYKLDFEVSKLGRWWHKNEEIDLIALNEESKEIAFFECKWSDLSRKEAKRTLSNLERKSTQVKYGDRRLYGIIAKNIERKEDIRDEGYFVCDLSDFEELILRN
ncbi:MAG: ATP-binding protein [Archaeoglobaceae archaeon]